MATVAHEVRTGTQPRAGRWVSTDWYLLLALISVAALLRIVFYTGFFGSDEVTYTAAAFKLLDGDWSVDTYVGSNRYGMNLPVAGFAYLFGRSEYAVNLYPFLFSLAEIGLVFYFGRKMLGVRAAFVGAAILAFLPLHAHYAGRLMPDAPLAFMITASFLLFWHGETRKHALSFAVAGLAAGLSFWIKPHAIIYLGVFLVYPLLFWRWSWQWLWMLGVFASTLLANFIFVGLLADDFLFLFDALYDRQTSGYLEQGAAQGSAMIAGPEYYFSYLFLKIYHTWLLGFLAVAALMSWWKQRLRIPRETHNSLLFLSWWSIGLIAIFSLFIVSMDPLLWIPKQPNYMLMFVAPLALLAGYAVAQLRGKLFWIVVIIVFAPSTVLIALEQNVIRTFTANSKATVAFSKIHPETVVYADTSGYRASRFYNLTNPHSQVVSVKFIGELMDPDEGGYYGNKIENPRHAILNTKTVNWGRNRPIQSLSAIPECWTWIGTLEPEGLGLGWKMATAMERAISFIPGALGAEAARPLGKLTETGTAHVYQIPSSGCK